MRSCVGRVGGVGSGVRVEVYFVRFVFGFGGLFESCVIFF